MRRVGLIAAIALLLAAGPARTSGASPQGWSGTAVGGVQQTRHFTANDGAAAWDDTSTYRGRFSFHFTAGASGAISGGGSGSYSVVKWHEQGTGSGGPFSCNAPKTAKPFKVTVAGRVSGKTIVLRLRLPNATEVLGADVDCSAHHKLLAGTTTYLRDSLAAVVGKGVRFTKKSTVVLHLSKHRDFMQDSPNSIPPGKNHVVQKHRWTITLHT